MLGQSKLLSAQQLALVLARPVRCCALHPRCSLLSSSHLLRVQYLLPGRCPGLIKTLAIEVVCAFTLDRQQTHIPEGAFGARQGSTRALTDAGLLSGRGLEAPATRAVDVQANMWQRVREQTPAAGHQFYISTAECRELRELSSLHQVVVVFSLARSAASTLTVELAAEMKGQYMDELFNQAVPLTRWSGGRAFKHTQAKPAALLIELLRAFQKPMVFKLNSPGALPIGTLNQLTRCVNWCPVVLERENVRDRWCSWHRATVSGWWGTRKKSRAEIPCPDKYRYVPRASRGQRMRSHLHVFGCVYFTHPSPTLHVLRFD